MTDKNISKQASFLGDANFPQVAQRDSKGARIRLFQILYEQYSHLDFSLSTDRPVAIAGLETRLIEAFGTTGGFGLFNRYLGRSLLWCRAPDTARLTRISFPAGQATVPSWSWMAYEGGISFLDLPFGEIDWTEGMEFQSPYPATGSLSTSRGRVSSSRHGPRVELRVIARSFDMVNVSSSSGIIWDDPTTPHEHLRCVTIGKLASESGKPGQKHWVIVFRELNAGRYERVGAGFLPKHKIDQGVMVIDSSVL